jgi:hypothetical protein
LAADELALCFCPSSGWSVGLPYCYMMTTIFGNKNYTEKSIFIMLQPHGSSIGARRTNHLRAHTPAQVTYTPEGRKKRRKEKKEKKEEGIISRKLDPYQC